LTIQIFSVNVSSSLPAFLGRQVSFAFEKSGICIENSIKPKGDMSGES